MKKVYAFLLMTDRGPEETRFLEGDTIDTLFVPVRSLEEGCETARKLVQEKGVGAIELCGAFGEEGAARIKEAAGPQTAVGYVIHQPSEDALFQAFFG